MSKFVVSTDNWFELKKGHVFELINIFFYNGEHHVRVKTASGVKEYPYVFFEEVDSDVASAYELWQCGEINRDEYEKELNKGG